MQLGYPWKDVFYPRYTVDVTSCHLCEQRCETASAEVLQIFPPHLLEQVISYGGEKIVQIRYQEIPYFCAGYSSVVALIQQCGSAMDSFQRYYRVGQTAEGILQEYHDCSEDDIQD